MGEYTEAVAAGREGDDAATDPARVAKLVEAVIAEIDGGSLGATSPERTYLVAAATTLRAMTKSD